MSEEYGDTSYDSVEGSQTSEYDGNDSAVAGDTGEFEPEYDDKGNPQPIPYDRFKESRSQLKDVRSSNEQLQQQIQELQENNRRQSEYNQQAYLEMQRLQQTHQQQSAADVPDEYVDPLETKVNQLEKQLRSTHEQLAHRQTEFAVQQAERELNAEIEAAQRHFPSMRKLDVVNAVIQNPRANIQALAKRSHEASERGYHDRLRRDGYSPRPRTLSRGQNRMPVAKDFGDDLEGAEAAAIEFLSNS